ncbi:ATP-grasp domain-containing protein [uncultured Subdoligranulum sp.]|mgnify:FL=1|uniref:carboxylate--amine ligase n=1 Tax=uncultured Subdoligranulum sp. TaxID=512298 RepID=UPI0026227E8A|nr:ATP-grasp domain-containing protein [uncultured Subdoligranulum sp.]
MMTDLIPVFLGADLNCYNFARAFHEAYGVESYAFGRYAMAPTKYSKIVHFTIVPDIDNEPTMLRVLHDFAKEHAGKRLYLFGCTDDYAAMIIRRKAELPEYIAPGPAADLYGSIQKKAEFYEVCDKFGIPYPTTKVLTAPVDAGELTEEKLGFAYPIIVKPSSSVAYWKFPFDGMKKVYTAADPAEAAAIVKQIYGSGYPDKMILQKMVPGGDDHMRVLTAFSDENGKVRAMCLGHTMVEEHTPHGLGNHAAIVTEDTTALPLVENIRQMLEACHYTGFSNFDIKCSDEPGDFRVFEINLRQGRSNYYVTAAGMNIAKLVVEKWNDGGTDCVLNRNEVFWHHVPAKVAFTHTEDKKLVAHAQGLKAQGKEACSLLYGPDLRLNPLRTACVLEQLRRQFKKFKTYYPKG